MGDSEGRKESGTRNESGTRCSNPKRMNIEDKVKVLARAATKGITTSTVK